jgi:hypothetical protein
MNISLISFKNFMLCNKHMGKGGTPPHCKLTLLLLYNGATEVCKKLACLTSVALKVTKVSISSGGTGIMKTDGAVANRRNFALHTTTFMQMLASVGKQP